MRKLWSKEGHIRVQIWCHIISNIGSFKDQYIHMRLQNSRHPNWTNYSCPKLNFKSMCFLDFFVFLFQNRNVILKKKFSWALKTKQLLVVLFKLIFFYQKLHFVKEVWKIYNMSNHKHSHRALVVIKGYPCLMRGQDSMKKMDQESKDKE